MNGPLWTIPMELMSYAALAAVGVLGVLRWRALACVVALGYLAFFLTMRNADLTGTMRHWFEYPAYFAVGALIALFGDVFLVHGRTVVLALMPLEAAFFWCEAGAFCRSAAAAAVVDISGHAQGGGFFVAASRGRSVLWHLCAGVSYSANGAGDVSSTTFFGQSGAGFGLAVAAGYASWHGGGGSSVASEALVGRRAQTSAGLAGKRILITEGVRFKQHNANVAGIIASACCASWQTGGPWLTGFCTACICPCRLLGIAWGRWRSMFSFLSAAL